MQGAGCAPISTRGGCCSTCGCRPRCGGAATSSARRSSGCARSGKKHDGEPSGARRVASERAVPARMPSTMNSLRDAISAFAAGDEEARREAGGAPGRSRAAGRTRPRRWRFTSSRPWATPAGACARRRRGARGRLGRSRARGGGAGGGAGGAGQRGPPQRRGRGVGHARRARRPTADGGAGGAARARQAVGRYAGADRRSSRRLVGGAAGRRRRSQRSRGRGRGVGPHWWRFDASPPRSGARAGAARAPAAAGGVRSTGWAAPARISAWTSWRRSVSSRRCERARWRRSKAAAGIARRRGCWRRR